MTNESKVVRFDNQVFSVGIDTHKSSWTVTIRTNHLQLQTFSMDPSPEQLAAHMQRTYPGGRYRSVYEAGFCGYWIHRDLTRLGFENIITNPADVPSTNKEKDRKNDPIDSRKLSREHENYSLTGIYVPTPKQESLRSLSRMWHQYARRGAQTKIRIKSFLNFTGIKIPDGFEASHWSINYIKMLSGLQFAEEVNRFVLDEHLEELKHIRAKRLMLLRRIRVLSKEVPTIQHLRTIPGIGQIASFILYAELIDIRRFKHPDDLMSYIGLVPSISASSTTEHVRGITQRHSRHLRYLLIEAAWIAVRKDPALTASYNELTKRMKKCRAIVRIAKKLTNRIRCVWIHQKPYVLGMIE
jgi:transposase